MMDFNKLDIQTKEQLHLQFDEYAQTLGGKNIFLKMIEDIRAEKPTPIVNKTGIFHTAEVKVTLNKPIFKETYATLLDAMRREEKNGDMLDGIDPKEYKATMNMMRTLKSATLTVELKKSVGKSFTFPILDASQEKKTKVTFAFKAIFFYRLDEAKKALNYEV